MAPWRSDPGELSHPGRALGENLGQWHNYYVPGKQHPGQWHNVLVAQSSRTDPWKKHLGQRHHVLCPRETAPWAKVRWSWRPQSSGAGCTEGRGGAAGRWPAWAGVTAPADGRAGARVKKIYTPYCYCDYYYIVTVITTRLAICDYY